mmetsp:Transcript_83665/g.167577  ORF Transcript_83665/g.167577 Transcript_83665/m.167577 type:complete len:99 (+) Transcript_83665:2134-2430(+)
MRLSWVPISATSPSFRTTILSALRMVESRCAMMIVVRFFSFSSPSSAACTTFSEFASSALVASSKIRIEGSRTTARAIAIRCFCPPDNWTPFSPTSVS